MLDDINFFNFHLQNALKIKKHVEMTIKQTLWQHYRFKTGNSAHSQLS